MSLDTPDRVRARAIEWHIRLRDGDDATWEAFAEWIAADPRHASAYDQVEAADHALDPLLPEVVGWMAEHGRLPIEVSGFSRPREHLVQIDLLFAPEDSPLRPRYFEF